ncbi:DUF3108 domain-containing protein [Rhodobacterales bacterium]|nr:DUF3108 domain-containing protein [Rhodobacterales bacterium]
MNQMRFIGLLSVALAALCGQAQASDLYLKYKLYAIGLPIGSGTLNLSLNDSDFSLNANGQTAAFGKLISDGKGSVRVKGDVDGSSMRPGDFAFSMTSEDEKDTVSMKLRGGKVREVVVNPPQDRMKERVKVTAKHLEGVLDPLTAAVLPAPKGLAPESCNRTLSLFDGKERYNIHLQYKSQRSSSTSDGRFKGKVLVCSARYEPVSGHRKGRKAIQALADNKSMEVWLAPVGDTPYLVPLRASITAPFGPLVIQADKYKFTD